MNLDLKQGQRVEYNVDNLHGFGKIVGKANNGAPIIGCSYIIEPEIPIYNDVYQYTHFICYEIQFKLVGQPDEVINNDEPNIIEYDHHGTVVSVQENLKGLHREHCLCWLGCKKFKPQDREGNCVIANALYKNCVDFNVVTPVLECPDFEK